MRAATVALLLAVIFAAGAAAAVTRSRSAEAAEQQASSSELSGSPSEAADDDQHDPSYAPEPAEPDGAAADSEGGGAAGSDSGSDSDDELCADDGCCCWVTRPLPEGDSTVTYDGIVPVCPLGAGGAASVWRRAQIERLAADHPRRVDLQHCHAVFMDRITAAYCCCVVPGCEAASLRLRRHVRRPDGSSTSATEFTGDYIIFAHNATRMHNHDAAAVIAAAKDKAKNTNTRMIRSKLEAGNGLMSAELPGHTARKPSLHHGFRSYVEAAGFEHVASNGLPGGARVAYRSMGREARVRLEIKGKCFVHEVDMAVFGPKTDLTGLKPFEDTPHNWPWAYQYASAPSKDLRHLVSIKDGGNLKKDPQNLGVFAPTAAGTSAADLNYAMWKRYGSRYRILLITRHVRSDGSVAVSVQWINTWDEFVKLAKEYGRYDELFPGGRHRAAPRPSAARLPSEIELIPVGRPNQAPVAPLPGGPVRPTRIKLNERPSERRTFQYTPRPLCPLQLPVDPSASQDSDEPISPMSVTTSGSPTPFGASQDRDDSMPGAAADSPPSARAPAGSPPPPGAPAACPAGAPPAAQAATPLANQLLGSVLAGKFSGHPDERAITDFCFWKLGRRPPVPQPLSAAAAPLTRPMGGAAVQTAQQLLPQPAPAAEAQIPSALDEAVQAAQDLEPLSPEQIQLLQGMPLAQLQELLSEPALLHLLSRSSAMEAAVQAAQSLQPLSPSQLALLRSMPTAHLRGLLSEHAARHLHNSIRRRRAEKAAAQAADAAAAAHARAAAAATEAAEAAARRQQVLAYSDGPNGKGKAPATQEQLDLLDAEQAAQAAADSDDDDGPVDRRTDQQLAALYARAADAGRASGSLTLPSSSSGGGGGSSSGVLESSAESLPPAQEHGDPAAEPMDADGGWFGDEAAAADLPAEPLIPSAPAGQAASGPAPAPPSSASALVGQETTAAAAERMEVDGQPAAEAPAANQEPLPAAGLEPKPLPDATPAAQPTLLAPFNAYALGCRRLEGLSSMITRIRRAKALVAAKAAKERAAAAAAVAAAAAAAGQENQAPPNAPQPGSQHTPLAAASQQRASKRRRLEQGGSLARQPRGK